MKFMVAVDLEGVACAVSTVGDTLSTSPNYAFACKQAVREANAAARALFDAGADQVVIWDNHGEGVNLDYDAIDERCDIALGVCVAGRWPLLDESYDGVLLVGYHAMDSTPAAAIAHTYASTLYQAVTIDGRLVGEMQIDAMLAGQVGVPVIFVSSDEAGVRQAEEWMPWIESVATKKAMAFHRAVSLHPKRACEAIYKGVQRAYARLAEMKTLTCPSPCRMEVRFKTLEEAQRANFRDMNGQPFGFADAYTRTGTVCAPYILFF